MTMKAQYSVADVYFIQEFAKLSTSEDGTLNVQRFKADVVECVVTQSSTTRPPQHQQLDPAENLTSERNTLLAQYFDEEFERLHDRRQCPVPELAKTVRRHINPANREGDEDEAGSKNIQKSFDKKFLLFTSEAYLALDDK